MCKKIAIFGRAILMGILLLIPNLIKADGPPPPVSSLLNAWRFEDTNWISLFGGAPLSQTNISSVTTWTPALLLDSSDPAWLQYPLVSTNGNTNLLFTLGTVMFNFSPDWTSVDQGGTGPGDAGQFIEVGTSNAANGWWSLYVNPNGTSLNFSGQTNGAGTNYLSAPISWASNTWHSIGLVYTATNSALYVDGALATNGLGVTVWPGTNGVTNGLFIGSDASGTQQVRGQMARLLTWTDVATGDYFSNLWNYVSATVDAYGGGHRDSGGLIPDPPSGTCVTGSVVYITNLVVAYSTNSGATLTFSIEGGIAGALYDVYATTNFTGDNVTNSTWAWLGAGTNCGRYTITNQPGRYAIYVLGLPVLAADGSGLTVAYEKLVKPSSTSDTFGTPYAWYLGQGINPLVSGIGSQDPDHDGLLNWQEYLYGTNPQVSDGFSIWVNQSAAGVGP